MNPLERKTQLTLLNDGWKVLRGGAPGFLAYKVGEDNKLEIKAVECKDGNMARLSPKQQKYKRLLHSVGIGYECWHQYNGDIKIEKDTLEGRGKRKLVRYNGKE